MHSVRTLKEKLIQEVEHEINQENDTIALLRQEIADREARIQAILNRDTEARQLLHLLKTSDHKDNGTGTVLKQKSVVERRREYLDACRMLMEDQGKITVDALHDLMGGARPSVSQFLIKNRSLFEKVDVSTYVMKEGNG